MDRYILEIWGLGKKVKQEIKSRKNQFNHKKKKKKKKTTKRKNNERSFCR